MAWEDEHDFWFYDQRYIDFQVISSLVLYIISWLVVWSISQ
jgi:hypothetical protein